VSQNNKKLTLTELKKSEQIVVRSGSNNFIDKLIFPNPVTIGLGGDLKSLLTTEGGIKINPAVPIDVTNTLYSSNGELFFNGSPLVNGGKNSNFLFDSNSKTLRLTGSLDAGSTGNIISKALTGSLTTLLDGSQFIKSGAGISVSTGTNGQITISALVQDTGIRASIVATTVGNVANSLHEKEINFTDADGRNVTFTYDKNVDVGSPARNSAISYTIGCKSVANDTTHAAGLENALNLASDNNDLGLNVARSDNVLTITQQKGGETGNTEVNGTAIETSLVLLSNANFFSGGSALLSSVNANYLTTSPSGDLNNERVLATGVGLTSVDAGPNSSFTLSIDTNVVPRKGVDNVFAGTQTFSGEIKAKHHKLPNGSDAFVAGKNIVITKNENGSLTFSSVDSDTKYTAGEGLKLLGNQFAVKTGNGLSIVGGQLAINLSSMIGSFLSIDASGKLKVNVTSGRGLSGDENSLFVNTSDFAGEGLVSSDGDLQVDQSKIAFLAGSTFTGDVKFNAGLSGSLTNLASGESYLIAGDNVTIVTQSSGQIAISSSYVDTTYLPGPGLELSGTLFSVALKEYGGLTFDDTEVILDKQAVIGNGLKEGTEKIIDVDESVVAFLDGATFTGNVDFAGGLRGSLTKLVDGTDFIVAGDNVQVVELESGAIEISASSTGITSPAGNSDEIQINFEGNFAAFEDFRYDSAEKALCVTNINCTSLTGSLTRLQDGTAFISAGTNITITTGTSGQIVISGAPTTLVAARSRFVQIVDTLQPANTPFEIDGADFSLPTFSKNLIDINLNGSLLYSGTAEQCSSGTADYSIYDSNKLIFSFELVPDDVIQATMLTSGSDTLTLLPGGITGPQNSIQFNDSGNFGGDSDFVYNSSSKTLTVPNLSGSLTNLSTGESFITTSGSIISIVTESNGSLTLSDSFATVPVIVYESESAVGSAKFLNVESPLVLTSTENSIDLAVQREKVVFEIVSSHPSNESISIPGANFSYANFENKRIDIFVNGQLLVSGSSKDYVLDGSDDGIIVSFDLYANDTIVAIIQ